MALSCTTLLKLSNLLAAAAADTILEKILQQLYTDAINKIKQHSC